METRFWKPKNTGDELAARITALEAQFKLALLEQKQELVARLSELDAEVEIMETELLYRIAEVEKSARKSSLPSDGEKKTTEEVVGIPGYKTWSQRKAERTAKTGSKDFAEKTLKRTQARSKPATE